VAREKKANSLVRSGEYLDFVRHTRGRAIVNEQKLPPIIVLIQDRFDCRIKPGQSVEHRHNDADESTVGWGSTFVRTDVTDIDTFGIAA
jgi:hypothetical protein